MPLTPPERLDLPGFTLRAWTRADADGLRLALVTSDAHLRTFTPWVVDGRVPGLSLEDRLTQHAADFAAGKEWVYGLFSSDGSEVLGGCGLYPRVGPTAVEVGYWLAVGHTGRGLATRATAALTRLAFLEPTIDHVEIHCDRRNSASSRVAERLGYRLETNSAAAADEILVWRLSREEYVVRVSNGPLE
jgi:RimJ/RimL family protein N-acetyltransferase